MAITKLLILLNGIPLNNAVVTLGEVGAIEKTTNESGEIAFPNIVPPWTGYTEVLVSSPIYASAKVKIVAGETTTIDLGERILE